jgi:hypothetical protein
MLVMGGMALALVRGCATRDQTGLQRGSLGVRVRVCLSADDAAGSNARVGAVEAKSDAADQCADVVLGKARVGADNADGRAVRALVDAVHEQGQVCDERPGVGLEDVFNGHGFRPLVFLLRQSPAPRAGNKWWRWRDRQWRSPKPSGTRSDTKATSRQRHELLSRPPGRVGYTGHDLETR